MWLLVGLLVFCVSLVIVNDCWNGEINMGLIYFKWIDGL